MRFKKVLLTSLERLEIYLKYMQAVCDRISKLITEGVNTVAELNSWKPFQEITASESLFCLKLYTLKNLKCDWLEEIYILK